MLTKNTPILNVTLLMAFIGLSLSACKKEEAAPPAAPPTNVGGNTPTPSTTPYFSDADGSLWAVRSFSTQSTPIGPMDIEIGLGVGAFSDDGFNSFVNVGTIDLNGTALTRHANNSYVSQPSQTNPSGINFSSGVEWTVQGGAGFPGFTRNITAFPFPTVAALTSAETVVRTNGYTLATTQVTGADSVLFLVGNVSRTLAGNATSCAFSADELSALAAGANIVQIVPFKYTSELIEGKRIYFGKQAVRTRSVTVQ